MSKWWPARCAAALAVALAGGCTQPVATAGGAFADAGTPDEARRWSGKKPPAPTPVPGPPIDVVEDLAKRWRRSEYDRVAAEPLAVHVLPTTPGLDSPEAVARAYVDALGRSDRDAMARITMGVAELEAMFGDALTEKARRGVAIEAGSVFLGLSDLPGPAAIAVGKFTPGQVYRLKGGIRIEGVTIRTDATMLDRSLLEVTIDGVPKRLEFMMMVELGGKWRLFERVFLREPAP